ncbi:hypothetical protein GCM10020358_68870 [Amorphoplanes nipponensis]|uniref:Uncharacterized protein n=1 Tax=Actinoplanes nipponensis TaxID=135950 RepID=A0A919MNY8_9ACTN|nr:hypothetical protein [Actinoplanes nipponensis]GIE51487.1 hypothetical protein Ani05nite_50210 [Actinoplanes nipponensis]
MSARLGTDQISFHVGEHAVTSRCALHPDFTESYPYGHDRLVPATWFVRVLTEHLNNHPAATPDTPAVEQPAPDQAGVLSTAPALPLDEFGREVVARCRWATDINDDDPRGDWPLALRLAVALVLGNTNYLLDMGPGPGYTPDQAAVQLVRSMTHPPANLRSWIEAIRNEIKPPQPGSPHAPWLPPKQLRTDL